MTKQSLALVVRFLTQCSIRHEKLMFHRFNYNRSSHILLFFFLNAQDVL